MTQIDPLPFPLRGRKELTSFGGEYFGKDFRRGLQDFFRHDERSGSDARDSASEEFSPARRQHHLSACVQRRQLCILYCGKASLESGYRDHDHRGHVP